MAEIALKALEFAKRGDVQTNLYKNIEYFHKIASEQNIDIRKIEKSPIIPVLIGDEKKALEVSKKLLRKQFFVHAIRYPTVKLKEARLRISLNANHNQEEIYSLIENIAKLLKK